MRVKTNIWWGDIRWEPTWWRWQIYRLTRGTFHIGKDGIAINEGGKWFAFVLRYFDLCDGWFLYVAARLRPWRADGGWWRYWTVVGRKRREPRSGLL